VCWTAKQVRKIIHFLYKTVEGPDDFVGPKWCIAGTKDWWMKMPWHWEDGGKSSGLKVG
jgi:hypothetical protein